MTPSKIDKDVERLIKKLNATHTPIYLDIEPEKGAEIKDCFPVVQLKVKEKGGRMVMGWQIWKSKHLIEAECHAVWEDEEGELRDITPKDLNINNILFVEDENMVYDEKQIDNIRLNITNNPLVDDLINVCKAIYNFDNKGERALHYDLTFLLTNVQKEHRHYLFEIKDMINFILSHNGNRKSLCPCNGQLHFKNCHGKDLDKKVIKDI